MLPAFLFLGMMLSFVFYMVSHDLDALLVLFNEKLSMLMFISGLIIPLYLIIISTISIFKNRLPKGYKIFLEDKLN
jgi:hypothetical protein